MKIIAQSHLLIIPLAVNCAMKPVHHTGKGGVSWFNFIVECSVMFVVTQGSFLTVVVITAKFFARILFQSTQDEAVKLDGF